MALPKIPEVRELMEAGVHFGHASGRWHPKMAPYIFCTRDKLHIIDLEKTRSQLEVFLKELESRAKSGKAVFLVGSKRQAAEMVREIGERLGINYVNERWLGGTLTNFSQMMQSIKRMKDAEDLLASDDAKKMLKKERVMLEAELRRMHAKFGGLRGYAKKPDVLVVIDPAYEHNAVKEARAQGVEIFAVVDTNADPSLADYVVPANDDGPKSLRLILGLIEQALASGLALRASAKEQEEREAAQKTAEAAAVKEPETEVLDAVEEKIEEEATAKEVRAKAAKAPKGEEEKETVAELVKEEA